MRFYLNDLPEHNLAPNGDMSMNAHWRVFGHKDVKCWQSANINNTGLCWYVNKTEQALGVTAGLRSGEFTLSAGQSYHLSLWIYLSQGTPTLPKICIYADDTTLMAKGNNYTLGYNGWQQMNFTFVATQNSSTAFLAAVYEGEALGAFYLDNVMLYPAATELNEVEIMPDWNIETGQNAASTQTRTLAGRLFIYDWHHFIKKTITLDFVPEDKAKIINRFWQNRTKLLLTATQNGALKEYALGVITNDRTPLNQYQPPYTQYFRGKIIFEEL